MLIMKNLGATLDSLTVRGALVAWTVAATATWPAASSTEAATEEKRILRTRNGRKTSVVCPAPLGIGTWHLTDHKDGAVKREAKV